MTIDSIITEWTYRLPKGYPESESDYQVLHDVLQEMTALTTEQRDQIVNQARGLNEQPGDEEIQPTLTDFMASPQLFTTYVTRYYTIEGQSIENLDALYDKLKGIAQPMYDGVIDILKDTTNPYYPLTKSDIRITGTALVLYDVCKVVKIPNGHWSELFFAFMFKGRVKAGVGGDENNIKSDVITTNPPANISIKSYESTTYDCGTLPTGAYSKLKKFIALGELLTGIDIETASMSTIELNKILHELESEQLQDEIKGILAQENSSFSIIRNAATRIRSIIGDQSPDYLENIIDVFCIDLDKTLHSAFVDKIDWWAMFNRNNNTLFLRPSEEIFETVRCKETHPRISDAIPNFHQGKVWLKGTSIGIFGSKYKD